MNTIQVVNFPNHLIGTYWGGWNFTMLDVNDDPIDLTGVTISAKFYKGHDNGTLTETYTIGTGLTLISAAAGTFKIDAQDPIDFTTADFYYFRITFDLTGTGDTVLITGQWKIEQ